MENFAHISQVITEQENLLRFDHFSGTDAWDLGSFLVFRAKTQGIGLAMSIRKLNGHILFQYCGEGTSINNQCWMQRKFNTFSRMECSSLLAWSNLNLRGQTLEFQGLTSENYAFMGGAFPIRLKGGELIGCVIVSALPHTKDHQFVVEALSDWLNVKDVPSAE